MKAKSQEQKTKMKKTITAKRKSGKRTASASTSVTVTIAILSVQSINDPVLRLLKKGTVWEKWKKKNERLCFDASRIICPRERTQDRGAITHNRLDIFTSVLHHLLFNDHYKAFRIVCSNKEKSYKYRCVVYAARR